MRRQALVRPRSLDFTFVVAGTAVGMVSAAGFVYLALPGLLDSATGTSPKIYWYLSRTSGLAAYGLLWTSVAMGLTITSRTAKLWPGGPPAFEAHQFGSLLALGFAGFHVLVLLGDRFIGYTFMGLMVPFASGEYRPLWVAVGQIGMYLGVLVALSWYVRRQIGRKTWRTLHLVSIAVYSLVLLHGIGAGTDTSSPVVTGMYVLTGGLTLVLLNYRILVLSGKPARISPRVRNGNKVTDSPPGRG